MKKLSVIIPLYNVENYVGKTATSIASQAFDGLEVIVIDDGSTDSSLAVCMKHLGSIDTVVIQQENLGLSSARNAGIQASSGQYILFLDSDDFLLPNAFENMLPLLESETPDVLFGRYLLWTPNKGLWGSNPYEFALPENHHKRTEYILCELPDPSWNAWRYICRGNFIKERKIFFEEGMLCEDVPWTLELLEQADSLSFLQEPFYAYYHRRSNSIMNTLNPQRLIDLNNIISKRLLIYKDRPAIYRKLVWQSFFYINEYCLFKRKDRKQIWNSYQKILPLYRQSTSITHRVTGQCQNPLLFHLISIAMLMIRQTRRVWKGITSWIRRKTSLATV